LIGEEEEEIKYIGGGYSGFNIFKYTLIIETIPAIPGDEEEWVSKTTHTISHYFGTTTENVLNC